MKNYWRNNDRFADFFNAVLFEGRQVIKPEELEDIDTEESSILEHREFTESIQTSRDNIKIQKKSTAYGIELVMLGMESQEHIHYAMPMRVMGYDYSVYKKQYDINADKCKGVKDLNGDEFLSGMRKTDKFTAVITVVVYYGEKPWDGARSLHEMLNIPEEMKKYVDALLIINNENLIELYKDFNFFNAFSKADDTLANAARSISEIISEPMYVNVDFQDVKTTLKDSGSAIIATAIGEGEHRITDAITKALHSPLLKMHDINTSKRLLFKFVCAKDSENPIKTSEIAEITSFTSKLPSSIDVKWGIGDDPTMGDKVKITVLASGFDVTINEEETIIISDTSENAKEPTKQEREEQKKIEEVYGADKLKEQERETARLKYAVLKPSQFDDHEVIALLERNPTHNRPQNIREMLRNMPETPGFAVGQQSRRQPEEERKPSGSQITFG